MFKNISEVLRLLRGLFEGSEYLMIPSSDAARAVREQIADRGLFAYVLTFGCQQNEADSEKLRGMALEMGYRLTDDPEAASLLLVNTCAIREHAELRALSIIGGYKHIREKRPDAVIGVCGCMAAEAHRSDELRRRYPYVSFTLAPGELHRLPERVLRALGRKRTFEPTDPATYPAPVEGLPAVRTSRHRAWVSIMYGCNNYCTYCIVPYVRGREQSRPSDAVYAEVKELVSRGVRDITLLGQNVNSYRSDCDFAALLRRLSAIPGDFLLRFMTSHPKDVPEELIRAIGECEKIAPHFHLPLQSGSDEVLSRMNRRYSTARYLETVDALRAARPGIALTSDIIVGFPGETDADFEATLDMLRRVRFDMIYSFIYSPRKGTPAATYPDAVPPSVSRERMERLLALQGELAREAAEPYLDTVCRVLVDEPSKDGRKGVMSGRTDTGKLVHFTTENAEIGRYARIRIERAEAFALYGSEI